MLKTMVKRKYFCTVPKIMYNTYADSRVCLPGMLLKGVIILQLQISYVK